MATRAADRSDGQISAVGQASMPSPALLGAWILLAAGGAVMAAAVALVELTPAMVVDSGPVAQCSTVDPLPKEVCLGSFCSMYCAFPAYEMPAVLDPPLKPGELVQGKSVIVWSSGSSGFFGPGRAVAIQIDGTFHSSPWFALLKAVDAARHLASNLWAPAILLLAIAFAIYLRDRPFAPMAATSFGAGAVAVSALVLAPMTFGVEALGLVSLGLLLVMLCAGAVGATLGATALVVGVAQTTGRRAYLGGATAGLLLVLLAALELIVSWFGW